MLPRGSDAPGIMLTARWLRWRREGQPGPDRTTFDQRLHGGVRMRAAGHDGLQRGDLGGQPLQVAGLQYLVQRRDGALRERRIFDFSRS